MELQELCCKEPTERGAVWFAWNPEVQGCGTEIPSGSALAAHLCALYDAKNDGVDLVDVLRVEETIDEQYAAASIVRLGTHGPLFYHLDTRPQTLLAQFEAYALKPLHGTIASRLSVGNCREICRAMRQLLDDGSFVVVDEVNVEKNTFGHLLSDEELRATCDALSSKRRKTSVASQACSQTIEGIVKERGEKKSGTWVKRRWYPLTSFKMHRDFYTELSNEFADFHSTHRWISMDTLDGNRKTVRHPLKWFYNFQSHILQRGYCFRQICFCGVPMDEPWYAERTRRPLCTSILQCQGCHTYVHLPCAGFSNEQFDNIVRDKDLARRCEFYCKMCIDDQKRQNECDEHALTDAEFALLQQASSEDGRIADVFSCPVTLAPMARPRFCSDSHTYDQSTLESLFDPTKKEASCHYALSPLTRAPLSFVYVPDVFLLRFARMFVAIYAAADTAPDRAIAAFLQTTHRIPNDEWAMTNVLRRDNAYELISTTQVRDQGISREERVVYDNQRQKMLLACADELHTV